LIDSDECDNVLDSEVDLDFEDVFSEGEDLLASEIEVDLLDAEEELLNEPGLVDDGGLLRYV
jgi:hypothetical protein